MIKTVFRDFLRTLQPHLQSFSDYSFVIKLEMTAYIEQTLSLLIFVTKWPIHILAFRKGCDFLAVK